MDEDEFVMEDGEGSEESLKDKNKKIRDELKACQKEKDEYLTGWQRAKADLVNARKDIEVQLAERTKFANQKLIESLLPAFDSFSSAMKGKGWDEIDPTWKSGVSMIHSQLLSTLKSYGAEPFDPAGDEFDPVLHEPLRMEKVKGKKGHVILETLQSGWKLNGKILRPAKVVVSDDT